MAVEPVRDSAEFRDYMDEVWRRLRVFSRSNSNSHTHSHSSPNRSAAIPSQERGSFAWLSAAGAFWRLARERANISRDEVAERLGVSVNQVRFFELGVVAAPELSEPRLRAYAEALGDRQLYEQFRERFQP